MGTQTFTLTLYVLDCPNCGMRFGIDNAYDDRRRQDGRGFHCPNGHIMSYHETEVMRLKKEVEQKKREIERQTTRNTHLRDQLQSTERTLIATKGHLTRQRKRIENGVCPHCRRHFANVERHMKSQHKEELAR